MNHQTRRTVITLAERAGREIAAIYRRGDAEVRDKADGTPLTDADLASERVLASGLRDAFDFPIASEETKTEAFATRRRWTTFWLVDPLDGTKEFVNRTGEFAVSIALVHQGRPVVGVIHAPMTGVTWSALAGDGAYRRPAAGAEDARLGPRSLPAPRTALVSRSHRSGGKTDQYLERLHIEQTLASGSAIKFGLMAEGEAHVYVRIGPTMEWDVAAGDCVCAEQGLEVVRVPEGTPLDYNTETLVNPPFIVRDPTDPASKPLPELD